MIALAAIFLAACAFAAPTLTDRDTPSETVSLTGVTHTVSAGLGGLHFDPDNVVAELGDIVEWHFLPANHSIAQSSFDKPCEPLEDGSSFFSGFNFATDSGENPVVYQLLVEDAKPIWYYCAQQKGNHCQSGMVGAINQDFSSVDKTLAKYREKAMATEETVIPPEQFGALRPNPQTNANSNVRC